MDDLSTLRARIDEIDAKIFDLFTARADLSYEIAAVKRAQGREVLDPDRERAKIADARSRVPEDLSDQGARLMELLMESSRLRQTASMRRDGEQRRFGLLGEHLGHSYSPRIHELLGSVPYDLFEVAPDDVGRFISDGIWDGINVTVPYKRMAAELADVRSARVVALGAANTLVRRADGTIFADNTDVLGFEELLGIFAHEKLGTDAASAFSGRTALVLGTGGAAQAIAYVLRETARAHIIFVSRSGPVDYSNVCELCPDAALIVNTTPVGTYPNCPASPLSVEQIARFEKLKGVIDIIYNPRIPGICLSAETLGIPWMSGLPMLVWQAYHASCIFQGRTLDASHVASIISEIDKQTAGICLIGMPGSGKSTTGRELARKLDRPFIDLDEQIALECGSTPERIIREQGEDAFRAIETRICAEKSATPGAIIAAGGGIVVRPENYALLHQNSLIVFLDRPLEELPTDGRPLSQATGVAELARQRMGDYLGWADCRISRTGSAQGDAEAIIEMLGL